MHSAYGPAAQLSVLASMGLGSKWKVWTRSFKETTGGEFRKRVYIYI